MERKLKIVSKIAKQGSLRNAISRWRSLVLDQIRLNREQAQTSLIQTNLQNKEKIE